MLNKVNNGLGEPLNVIISALSSSAVLTNDGFLNYARAIGFSTEFLFHIGDPQKANLGDGHGWVDETKEFRQDFGNPVFGTLRESIEGGNHFRLYRQNGPTANTGALFLSVSQEMNFEHKHNIVPDGYNVGRDNLAKAAVGYRTFGDVKYNTTEKRLTGLLPPGSHGLNHGPNIATDGVTVLLTVTIE